MEMKVRHSRSEKLKVILSLRGIESREKSEVTLSVCPDKAILPAFHTP